MQRRSSAARARAHANASAEVHPAREEARFAAERKEAEYVAVTSICLSAIHLHMVVCLVCSLRGFLTRSRLMRAPFGDAARQRKKTRNIHTIIVLTKLQDKVSLRGVLWFVYEVRDGTFANLI